MFFSRKAKCVFWSRTCCRWQLRVTATGCFARYCRRLSGRASRHFFWLSWGPCRPEASQAQGHQCWLESRQTFLGQARAPSSAPVDTLTGSVGRETANLLAPFIARPKNPASCNRMANGRQRHKCTSLVAAQSTGHSARHRATTCVRLRLRAAGRRQGPWSARIGRDLA